VDEMVRKAVAAGGTTYNKLQDHGFMYGHGFQDLDGHIWEVIYMEPVYNKQELFATAHGTLAFPYIHRPIDPRVHIGLAHLRVADLERPK
jgi:hypothetical protein